MNLNTKPEGGPGVLRPELRWLDDVEVGMKTLGKKRRRLKAQHRKEWTVIVKETKAKLKGL
jgi:hypothetical protein